MNISCIDHLRYLPVYTQLVTPLEGISQDKDLRVPGDITSFSLCSLSFCRMENVGGVSQTPCSVHFHCLLQPTGRTIIVIKDVFLSTHLIIPLKEKNQDKAFRLRRYYSHLICPVILCHFIWENTEELSRPFTTVPFGCFLWLEGNTIIVIV